MTAQTSNTDSVDPAGYVDSTSLQPGHYGKPLILDRIFMLLVKMIEVLQRTAAAQAQRLNFLSNWQKAYTDEMNQIHAFVAGNGDGAVRAQGQPNQLIHPTTTQSVNWNFKGLDSGDSHAGTIRQDLNTVNTTYTQEMQGNNNVISNDAKALQSNVNQSNDAVQSQTDMATSVLQQLSTILSAIYQS